MTVTFLDPFALSPLVFSLPSAQWLVDTRRVQPEPQGLFGFLKAKAGAPSGVPEELARQGFSASASARSRETDLFLAALEVVSRPQARVVVSEATPGAAPARHQFFLREGQCSLAWFDEQAFYVSAAVPSLTLSTGLARKLTHEAPSPEPLVLLPKALAVVAEHFPAAGGKPKSRERAAVEAALGGAAAVDTMLGAEVLVARGTSLEPGPAYALALESMQSECFVRLEASALSPARAPSTTTFTLLGPPRRRVLSEDVVVGDKTLTALRRLSVDDAMELAGALFS